MRAFNFRLQKVLGYREIQEQWARDSYLDARTARLEAEVALIEIGQRRHQTVGGSTKQLAAFEDNAIEQQIVVNVLLNQEQNALAHWTQAKIELELLKNLRGQEYASWKIEADDSLHRELEEWAAWKRAA